MPQGRIAGYDYRADHYHGDCIIERLIDDGLASPAARDMPTEDALDQIAEANAIDRYDERTYDQDDFPKVIFGVQLDGTEYCGRCHEEIG